MEGFALNRNVLVID